MLVLSRTLGESIHIGDDIRITVTAIEGDRVRIGIEAPREVPVNREEVLARLAGRLPTLRCRRVTAPVLPR